MAKISSYDLISSHQTTDTLYAIQNGSKRTTLQKIADWVVQSAASFLPSGTTPTYGWVTRTLQAKLGEVQISVKDVKNSSGIAVAGDGVTDDSTGIQAAIDYVNAVGGGIVWCPPATYK